MSSFGHPGWQYRTNGKVPDYNFYNGEHSRANYDILMLSGTIPDVVFGSMVNSVIGSSCGHPGWQ